MTSPLTTPQSTTVTVGGHTYRVNSSATTDELARLAALVDERLAALPLGQRGDPKSLVLVALGLAHDLEQERIARVRHGDEVKGRIRGLVTRIEDALGHVDLEGNALDTPALPEAPLLHPTADVPEAELTSSYAVARPQGGGVQTKRAIKAP